MDIKKFALVAILIIVFLATYFVYKYAGINIESLYSTSVSQELGDTFRLDEIIRAQTAKINEVADEEDLDKKITHYDELLKIDKNAENQANTYLSYMRQNLSKFKKIKLGPSVSLAKAQEKYYSLEIPAAEDSLAFLYWGTELDKLAKDKAILNRYMQRSAVDATLYSNNFSQISHFEKYLDEDFKYENEDYIRKYYPEGILVLDKYRNGLKPFYKSARAYRDGDQTQVQNLSSLSGEILDVGKEIDAVYEMAGKKFASTQQNEIKVVVKTFVLAKELEKSGKSLNVDLVGCQNYWYKTIYFRTKEKRLPEATNFKDLIKELGQVEPKTDRIDNAVDLSKSKFENRGNSLVFSCYDEVTSSLFTYQLDL